MKLLKPFSLKKSKPKMTITVPAPLSKPKQVSPESSITIRVDYPKKK